MTLWINKTANKCITPYAPDLSKLKLPYKQSIFFVY